MIELICQDCQGGGKLPCAGSWGHYGDCNADAGEGRKTVIRDCDACAGTGRIQETYSTAAAVAWYLVQYLSCGDAKRMFLRVWALKSVFGLTSKGAAEIGKITGYSRQHVHKEIHELMSRIFQHHV